MSKKYKKEANHYVDNKEFFDAMCIWKKDVLSMEDLGDRKPPVTDYIGECFLKIATHLSYRPNFINYEYREEMVMEGVENCLMYASNFDPEKSTNPFSYFTQIIYYAFLRRIQKEKKQLYIKYKLMEKLDKEGKFNRWVENGSESENHLAKHFNLTQNDINKFESKKTTTNKKVEDTGSTLDGVFEK